MLLNELNSTSWMSNGMDRKMSRIPPIGQLTHQGEPALARPNKTPRLVPMATEAKVMAIVVSAPFSMKRMSFHDSEPLKNMSSSSITEQARRNKARAQCEYFGD